MRPTASVALLLLTVTVAYACRPTGPSAPPEEERPSPTAAAKADAGAAERRQDAAADKAPAPAADPVKACKAAMDAAGDVMPHERGPYSRSKCGALFSEGPCGEGLQALGERPQPEKLVEVLTACTAAYCPRLGDEQPPLCRAKLAPESLARPVSYEFGRFGGDVIALQHDLPLSWARNVAFNMTFDWLPPTAPSGPEPEGRFRASLQTTEGTTSVLVVTAAAGDEVGRWTFSGREEDDDVERALDSIEARVRGAIVDLDVDRSVHGKTLVRVRTGLLFLGARPITPMGGGGGGGGGGGRAPF